MKMYHMAGN